jgi:hypothetical protein
MRLMAKDLEGYRAACREMLRRFAEEPRPDYCERTAKATLIAPGSPDDIAAAVALAEKAVTGTEDHRWYWYFQLTKALAEYRAGHDEEALAWLDRMSDATNIVSPSGIRFSVRAMANARLGRADSALTALGRARQIMSGMQDPARTRIRDVPNLHDWVFFRVLLDEAEQRVGQATGAAPAKPNS